MNKILEYNSVLIAHSVNDCNFITPTSNIAIRDNQKENRKVFKISSVHIQIIITMYTTKSSSFRTKIGKQENKITWVCQCRKYFYTYHLTWEVRP